MVRSLFRVQHPTNEPNHDLAAKVFFKEHAKVSNVEHKANGDYMFYWFCQLCIRIYLPFQIHTGLAKLNGSRPLLIEPIILLYPMIQFVLLHVGYPGMLIQLDWLIIITMFTSI